MQFKDKIEQLQDQQSEFEPKQQHQLAEYTKVKRELEEMLSGLAAM